MLREEEEKVRKKVLADVYLAIMSEPELPGHMPDDMWEAIRNDRDAVEQAMVIAVQVTKDGILKRVMGNGALE